jgi:uncharacterized protein YbjT (DUF2867 family)
MLEADLDDVESTAAAARGCGPAYYLVHSMVSTGSGYAETDRRMARPFAQAAERAGISRIIYLGGLGETGAGLSEHLASRREVEAMLASGSVPVTVFRAGMVIGAGSASFEILRYLVERLPVMVTPKWVTTESQPIAVGNVLGYLVDCLRVPATVGDPRHRRLRHRQLPGADADHGRRARPAEASGDSCPRAHASAQLASGSTS